MVLHHHFLVSNLDNIYLNYRIDYIKKRYYYDCSFSQPFKTKYFMEELTKEIKRLKKDNDRFKLNEKLKECQKANKQLEKLFESFERELLKEDISKEREEEIIDILDSEVYMIGR